MRLVLLTLLATGASFVGAGHALAYGRADHPVAQVEVSGNCDNATFCNQAFGGTGGLWIWAELDQDGSVDATFAGCGHTIGGGGPQSAGAGGGPVSGSWTPADNLDDAFASNPNVFPVALATNADGSVDFTTVPYYVITLHSGGPEGDFVFAVPAQVGHYNYGGLQFLGQVPPGTNIPGLSFQTEVAP